MPICNFLQGASQAGNPCHRVPRSSRSIDSARSGARGAPLSNFRGRFPSGAQLRRLLPDQGKEPDNGPMEGDKGGLLCLPWINSTQRPHPPRCLPGSTESSSPCLDFGCWSLLSSSCLSGPSAAPRATRSPHRIRPADPDGRFSVSPMSAGGLSCVWRLLGGRRFRATAARSISGGCIGEASET